MNHSSTPSIQTQVTLLLDDIRVRLAGLGILTDHLDDHALYEVCVTAVYRVDCTGLELTPERLLAALGVEARTEVGTP